MELFLIWSNIFADTHPRITSVITHSNKIASETVCLGIGERKTSVTTQLTYLVFFSRTNSPCFVFVDKLTCIGQVLRHYWCLGGFTSREWFSAGLFFSDKLLGIAGVRDWASDRFVYHFLLISISYNVLMTKLSLLELFFSANVSAKIRFDVLYFVYWLNFSDLATHEMIRTILSQLQPLYKKECINLHMITDAQRTEFKAQVVWPSTAKLYS